MTWDRFVYVLTGRRSRRIRRGLVRLRELAVIRFGKGLSAAEQREWDAVADFVESDRR